MDVSINQVFRRKREGERNVTIRITDILPNGVRAIIVTDKSGDRPTSARNTILMFRTLKSDYVRVDS